MTRRVTNKEVRELLRAAVEKAESKASMASDPNPQVQMVGYCARAEAEAFRSVLRCMSGDAVSLRLYTSNF